MLHCCSHIPPAASGPAHGGLTTSTTRTARTEYSERLTAAPMLAPCCSPAAVGLHMEDDCGRLTWYVMIVAMIASAGGLLFGYDLVRAQLGASLCGTASVV